MARHCKLELGFDNLTTSPPLRLYILDNNPYDNTTRQIDL